MKVGAARPTAEIWVVLGLSMAATVFFFHRAVFSDQIFVYRDILRVYYPLRQYWVERVMAGEFPDWYPYDGFGQSLPGMIISGVFHPSNILYLVLPLTEALKVNTLLAFPIASTGVFVAGRHLGLSVKGSALAATTFTFSGYLVSITNNLLYLMAAATVPWALWAAIRHVDAPSPGKALLAAGLLALVLFAGDPQSFGLSMALIVVVVVCRDEFHGRRRALLSLSTLLGLAILLAAVQIVPGLFIGSQSHMTRQSVDLATIWSVHPLRLIEVVLGPLFAAENTVVRGELANTLLGQGRMAFWADSLFIGSIPVTLTIAALVLLRRTAGAWIVFAAWFVLLMLSMGRNTGLYEIAFEIVPAWSSFRYPEKLTHFVVLGVALGAGAGLDQLIAAARPRRVVSWVFLALAGAGLLAAALEFGQPGALSRFRLGWDHPPSGATVIWLHQSMLRGLLSTSAALGCGFLVLRLARPQLVGFSITLIVLGSLLFANEGMYPLGSPALLESPPEPVASLLARSTRPTLGGRRVYSGPNVMTYADLPHVREVDGFAASLVASLASSTPALWHIENSNAYLPGASARAAHISVDRLRWFFRYSTVFGTPYLTIGMDEYAQMSGPPEAIIATNVLLKLHLLRNTPVLPRAYAARAYCVPDQAAAMELLLSDWFPFGGWAIAECGRSQGAERPTPVKRPGRVQVVEYQPERVDLVASLDEAALVVLNDAHYPGWTATVDGVRREILAVNGLVRGVPVGKGRHEVVFSFRTPGLVAGASISLLSLLVVTALALAKWRSR